MPSYTNVFMSREGFMGDVMVGNSPNHDDPEMVEFRTFGVIIKRSEELLSWISREQTQNWSESQLALSPEKLLL